MRWRRSSPRRRGATSTSCRARAWRRAAFAARSAPRSPRCSRAPARARQPVGPSTGLRQDHRRRSATSRACSRCNDQARRLRPISGVAQGRPEQLNHLILLQDWRPTQQFRDELLRQFFGAGAMVFGFALAGALIFSRRMSRPLREIAAAAQDIAAGNWARQVPVSGSAEATDVAVAFNGMTHQPAARAGAAAARRVSRSPDAAAEPRAVHGSPAARDHAPDAPSRVHLRGAVRRSRSLQDRQRQPRPSRRRPAAARDRAAG